ncbi:MAG: PspC domain-containing protein [Methanosarcina sp.]|nr:PspC domain-containing protein [Methanosarcina sp.]
MQESPDIHEKKETEKSVSEVLMEHETASRGDSGAESEEETEEKNREVTGEKPEEETGEKEGEEKKTTYTMERRLTKSRTNRMIFGVCGGLGEYLEIDPTLVRLAFVFLTLANGIGLIIYIVLAIIMPSEEDISMPPNARGRSPQSTWESPEMTGESLKKSDRNRLLGAILLIVGVYLLLDTLSIFRNFWWLDELFLPVILILGGAWLLLKHRK